MNTQRYLRWGIQEHPEAGETVYLLNRRPCPWTARLLGEVSDVGRERVCVAGNWYEFDRVCHASYVAYMGAEVIS